MGRQLCDVKESPILNCMLVLPAICRSVKPEDASVCTRVDAKNGPKFPFGQRGGKKKVTRQSTREGMSTATLRHTLNNRGPARATQTIGVYVGDEKRGKSFTTRGAAHAWLTSQGFQTDDDLYEELHAPRGTSKTYTMDYYKGDDSSSESD